MDSAAIDFVSHRLGKFDANHDLAVATTVELRRIFNKFVAVDTVKSRLDVVSNYRRQLAALRSIPIVEQRTDKWYKMRDSMMTASDLAQALGKGKFATQKDFFVKKSGYVDVPFDATIPPLKWGTMYEFVATKHYEELTGTTVHEFGLIQHPKLPWFGCSPDGITDHGIMVEIKCPYRRLIDGNVPEQYYYQVQGQLEVCGLDECDFLECKLSEYDDIHAFTLDAHPTLPGINKDGNRMGIILEKYMSDSKTFDYKYSPAGMAVNDTVVWMQHQLRMYPDYCKVHFWSLDFFSIVRIHKDPAFITKALTDAAHVWDTVLHFRSNKPAYDMHMSGFTCSHVEPVTVRPTPVVNHVVTQRNERYSHSHSKKSATKSAAATALAQGAFAFVDD